MALLDDIKTICESIPGYTFIFEEAKMMNVEADNKPFPCIFFEEYRNGSYHIKYGQSKTTKVILYFMDKVALHQSAETREAIRGRIEQDAVLPFIEAYNESGLFKELSSVSFTTPIPRFDVNEVSIRIEFDCEQSMCRP